MRVLLTSPWIPAEWIQAHGLTPDVIWLAKNSSARTLPLAAGVCAFAERAVQLAENHPDDAVVFTTACDQMRRGFDAAQHHGSHHTFLFNLPATQTSAARLLYRAELERLGKFLITLGGNPPAPEQLLNEMLRSEAIRRQLRAVAPTSSARALAESIVRFHREGVFSMPLPDSSPNLIPLALVGGPLAEDDWTLFDMLEASGARIVVNASKGGERSLCPTFEAGTFCEKSITSAADPLDALASGYFEHITDVFQRPNTRLYDWLRPRLATRCVRGIVLWHFTGCDLWRAEAQSMREAFGLPVLLLEADESAGISPRDQTRFQAFVETLK